MWIVLISLVILLISNIGYSADICFTEPVAGKMITELEKGRIDTQELLLCKKINLEKDNQSTLKDGVIKAKDDQLNICKSTIIEYQTLRVNDKKACDEAISKAKPSFKDIILYTFGVLGAGLIIGLIL